MDADSAPVLKDTLDDSFNRILSIEENEADDSIHAFNLISNITVIEKQALIFEGSDSGVEVLDTNDSCPYQRTLSSNFQDLAQSCNSSVISCCSNYEEAYNLLVRRNSTLIAEDRTSENGSESSSITGSSSSRNSKRLVNAKKKVNLQENKKVPKERSRSKPPITPRRSDTPARVESIDRLQGKIVNKNTPPNLDLTKKDSKRISTAKAVKTPATTPTDDGRWPSVNSKPAPLMSRSFRGVFDSPKTTKPLDIVAATKSIEKYATLPRRKKERSTDSYRRDNSINRIATTKKPREISVMPKIVTVKKPKQKIKIYHEFGVQTALTVADVDNAMAGLPVNPNDARDIEKCDKSEQADLDVKKIETKDCEIDELKKKCVNLQTEHELLSVKLVKTERRLRDEQVEKEGIKEELVRNSQRVLTILRANSGDDLTASASASSDSLLVLETRFQNVSQIVIRQEDEISKLNNNCRCLQIELEKSLCHEKILLQQQHERETEAIELQDFIKDEISTLSETIKETENDNCRLRQTILKKNEECHQLSKSIEQKWQENLSLQVKMGALEAKSRELLVHQGSSVSGTAVALSALIARLEGLVDELVTSYNISDQELEDVIFHNEAFSNSSSSPDAIPEKNGQFFSNKLISPKKGSSFVSAVINAIKNAASQNPFGAQRENSKENLCRENSSSNEMLESETEPCLMMEHVLEDVVVPDGHSHNMISSCHSILSTHSDSYLDLSRSFNNEIPSLSDFFPSLSLVDQVIDVDNLITRLLKVIRIIQLENDDCMNELQEQRDILSEQVHKQKENNKLVGVQLKDWEILGARLKSEVKELMQQLRRKNNEIEMLKIELNKQRDEVEKLNQDVCDLSTALSKAEHKLKTRESDGIEEIQKLDPTNVEAMSSHVLPLEVGENEVPVLKSKLAEKEQHLKELTQEFVTSKQILTTTLKEALRDSKRQYDAIDKALDVLHNNKNLVQQCTPLAELQEELEKINFQSASAMPIAPSDCNANAALLRAMANLQINTTA